MTPDLVISLDRRNSPSPFADPANVGPTTAEFGLAEVCQAPPPRIMQRQQPDNHPDYADQPGRPHEVDVAEITDTVGSPALHFAQQERDNEDDDLDPLGREGSYRYSNQYSDPERVRHPGSPPFPPCADTRRTSGFTVKAECAHPARQEG